MRPSVMTSCGDEAIPLATNHWPAMKLNDAAPSLNHLQSALAYKQATTEVETGACTTDALVNAAVLRQKLELYWSQVLQAQQSKSLSARERKPLVEPPSSMPSAFQSDPLAEARNLMQRLMGDKSTSLPADAPSMPLSSLVAMAANNKANSTYPTFSSRSPATGFSTELGNLLPPPPLLPTSLAPHHALLTNASPSSSTTVQTTTSTTPLDLSKATSHDIATAASTAASLMLMPSRRDERKSDANQPLDLSTSTKRQHSDDRTTILPDKPVLQSTPQRKPVEPSFMASNHSNGMMPPMSAAVPPYSQALATNQALSALNAQQLIALSPYLHNVRNMPRPFAQNGQQPQPQPPQYPPAGQEYLQKWLQAAQQRQQASVVAQPATKKPRTVRIYFAIS